MWCQNVFSICVVIFCVVTMWCWYLLTLGVIITSLLLLSVVTMHCMASLCFVTICCNYVVFLWCFAMSCQNFLSLCDDTKFYHNMLSLFCVTMWFNYDTTRCIITFSMTLCYLNLCHFVLSIYFVTTWCHYVILPFIVAMCCYYVLEHYFITLYYHYVLSIFIVSICETMLFHYICIVLCCHYGL